MLAFLTQAGTVASAQTTGDFDWATYGQLTGTRPQSASGEFDLNRMRVVLSRRTERLRGHLQLELAADDLSAQSPGLLPEIVFDVYGEYRLNGKQTLRLGQFKTPLGMDFNRPASNLATIPRGMEAGLVLHRDVGVMLSGRRIGPGFGYDVGLFNPAGRSSATRYQHSQIDDDRAAVVRGHFDRGFWHAELSAGATSAAGGPGTGTYRVADLSLRYRRQKFNLELECINGSGIRGDRNRDERVCYAHAAFDPAAKLELVARHYVGSSSLGTVTTRLGNTHLGATWRIFDRDPFRGQLQATWVLVDGNAAAYTGVRAYREDTFLVQLQLYTGG